MCLYAYLVKKKPKKFLKKFFLVYKQSDVNLDWMNVEITLTIQGFEQFHLFPAGLGVNGFPGTLEYLVERLPWDSQFKKKKKKLKWI